jgi:hypothetical protein
MMKYFDMFTDLKARSKNQQAKEDLMRSELMRDYTQMVETLERTQQPAKQQRTYFLIFMALSLVSAFVIFIRYRNQKGKMRFELVRRDFEERKVELEQRRLQAELNQQTEAMESLRSELNKQQLLVGLMSGLEQSTPASTGTATGDFKKVTATESKAKAWEEFEYRFQQLHSGFYDRLNQLFPQLTINDRRLCAFLKLDMTTKEISAITGQSVGAVNMARIRLRNKLGITHSDTELFTFLSEL